MSSLSKDLFVSADGTNPTVPYADWSTAANVIQAAINLAETGDMVYVSDGIYNQGGMVTPGFALTNRVCITNAVTVKSMNGPEHSIIVGKKNTYSSWRGPGAIRGAYLADGAILSGFTITNGHTFTSGNIKETSGGGVCGPSSKGGTSMVTNCVLNKNTAMEGGGAGLCVLYNCRFVNNSSLGSGGGTFTCTLNYCTIVDNSANYGGGSSSDNAYSCIITNNQAWYTGGGAYYGSLNNCLISGNTSPYEGGGVYSSYLYNSTVTKNTSTARSCGGICNSYYVKNSIIVDNTAALSPTNFNNQCEFIQYNCLPRSAGTTSKKFGNIVANPIFVNPDAGDFSLQTNSPCINAGYNSFQPAGNDLRGAPRPLDGTVDMGCYEYFVHDGDLDSDLMPNLWEVEHGLNMADGLDAAIDSDGDSFSNEDEYIADTHPCDSSSYFCFAVVSNIPQWTCYFDSSTNRIYSFQTRTNLIHGVWTNIPGHPARAGIGAGDSFAPSSVLPTEFYKIKVELP
jgi:hypothetical protein